jgi:hypothetical protein
VNRQLALEAQEQVLAVRVDGRDGAAGEALGPAGAGEARVRRRDRVGHVTGQHRADPVGGVVDGVTLGHGCWSGYGAQSLGPNGR